MSNTFYKLNFWKILNISADNMSICELVINLAISDLNFNCILIDANAIKRSPLRQTVNQFLGFHFKSTTIYFIS